MQRFKRTSLVAVFAVSLFAGSGLGTAASKECSRVGAWHGVGDQGFTWMVVLTAGADATSGQIVSQWVRYDPTFGGLFPDAKQGTNGMGVWKKTRDHTNRFTWFASALDDIGGTVYTVRTSGTETMLDCDRVSTDFVLELWVAGQDMANEPPFLCLPGTATHTRMSVAQAGCPD